MSQEERDVARVGYARVSSVGQSLEVQLDKLKRCDRIYQEKKSGASPQRPQLKACLDYVRGRYSGGHPPGPAGALDATSVSDRRAKARCICVVNQHRCPRMPPDDCSSICWCYWPIETEIRAERQREY